MAFSMDRWVGKVAVVTGASAGIGKAVAEDLVISGLQVVGCARRVENIEQHAKQLAGKKGKLYAVKCDVSKEDDIVNAFKWIKDNVGPVAILVNNAGILGRTNIVDGDYQIWKSIIDTNLLGLCAVTREAARDMRAHNTDGHIINIGSVAGHQIQYCPELNVYGASKFGVTALTETCRQEFRDQKLPIKITQVSPAIVDTEIFEINKIDETTTLGQISKNPTKMKPSDVSQAVIYALSTAPYVQVQDIILRHMHDPC